jgi:hypothetical protein
MPATSWNTTTIAGALCAPTVRVPVPWPPVAESQALHVIAVTVVLFVAHPTMSVAGRTCGVGPGPQDRTAGSAATVVEVVSEDVVVVDACGAVVEAPVAEELLGGELPEPTLNPMAIPTPRAARTRTPTPARTIVLRRIVMSCGSSFATATYGTWRRSENDEWAPEPRGCSLNEQGNPLCHRRNEHLIRIVVWIPAPKRGAPFRCRARLARVAGLRPPSGPRRAAGQRRPESR